MKSEKICPRCGENKPLTEFYHRNNGVNGYSSYCKQCDKEYHRQWYSTNRPVQLGRIVISNDDLYSCLGFLFAKFVHPEDVFDLRYMKWKKTELLRDLRSGNIPVGAIIKNNKEAFVVVENLELKPITEVIR